MKYTAAICHKETGEKVGEVAVESRKHVTNYQANASWNGIFKPGYADSMDGAAQLALDSFSRTQRMHEFDIGPLLPIG